MKRTIWPLTLLSSAIIFVSGCNNNDKEQEEIVLPPEYITSVSFTLDQTNGEWLSGFADYPVGNEDEWELTAQENSEFTLSSGDKASGYLLHSYNRSDDTKMYISRKIEGLIPNTHYDVDIALDMATNVNDMCMGIGGAPHSVTVKAGLSKSEPAVTVDEIDHYRLTLDMGNQVQSGLDGQALGHIGLSNLDDCDPGSTQYGIKSFENSDNTFEVTSDDNGELWLTLLTDSGFEGPSSLYFTQVDLTFNQSNKTVAGFTVDLDFSQELHDIESVFFDYPIGREFEWEHEATPLETVTLEQGGSVTGYLLHSYNRSDDTGMLLHTPIKGLAANSSYSATFKTTIASNVNNQCFGIGGGPHAVSVKTGLSLLKPNVSTSENDDHLRLNIDLGNNTQDGVNGITLGDIGAPDLLDCDPGSNLFAIKEFDSQLIEKELTINTDDKGTVYFSVATDSGFEGPTTMLFTQASVTFNKTTQ